MPMPVRRFTTVLLLVVCWLVQFASSAAALDFGDKRAEREAAIAALPLDRLTQTARKRVEQIISHPTMFRRLPTQGMDCDRDMFLFLVRHPEVLVGIWDVMDITQVQMQRTGPYNLVASDGQGTSCEIELIYGDSQTHLYIARGKYEGSMVAKPLTGSGVFVLHSSYARSSSQRETIGGQMDVFLDIDSIGADLVVRTLGPLIGKSADHNFVETAKFIAQISQASEVNPEGVKKLGQQIPQVSDPVRAGFIDTAIAVGLRNGHAIDDEPPIAMNDSPLQRTLDGKPPVDTDAPEPERVRIASTSRNYDGEDASPSSAIYDNPVQPRKMGMNLRR
ncbi:hypothetical protein Poly24_22270 [Rosistilla carotiformis]|uniref:Secreted protein n=1 Tax=Rosistilla carotiformis TaxID=2528017 RepID=A0A518JSL0_9BACT|nr:hypothetical protein [Rosistilla carotiformis]QDV68518.1 hypothetical protein Poly24_22270 [Rosistilla carotiformis]